MPKCKISEVVPLGSKYESPILAHFQNGSISPNIAADFDCYLAKDESANDARVAIAVSNDNVYSSRVAPGQLRNFIGILNKSTNKMRLIEVEECSMLSQHYEAPRESIASFRTKEQSRRMLAANFGGKTAMKAIEKKERMKINVDVVKDKLNRTINATKTDIADEKDDFDINQQKRSEHLDKIIPPMNKAAKKLDEVYKLPDLIALGLLVRLETEAAELLRTDPQDIPITTKYLIDIIKQCQDCKNPDSAENLTKIKVCIYIDALINFLKKIRVRKTDMQNVAFSEITQKVETDIRQKFSEPDSNKIFKTSYIEQKTKCYIIVLSLLISEKYEMEISNFVEAINTSKSGLLKLATVIPVRNKSGSDVITFTLPSKIRSATFTRRKRRTL